MILFLFLFSPVLSWGVIGHALTARLATELLNTNATCPQTNEFSVAALSNLTFLLNQFHDPSLESIASWADQVREQQAFAWSEPLHFIDTADWACKYNPITDCVDDVCVAGAILNYTKQLTSADSTYVVPDQAMKFVVHFTGDIHQPLHVSFKSNLGGNTIKGTFYGSDWNLHAIWDDAIIQQRIAQQFSGSEDAYGTYLLGLAQSQSAVDATCFTNGESLEQCVGEWANESAALACQYAYVNVDGSFIQNGFNLGDAYYQNTAPIVDQQLAKAAVRMASLFSVVWSGCS